MKEPVRESKGGRQTERAIEIEGVRRVGKETGSEGERGGGARVQRPALSTVLYITLPTLRKSKI